MNGDIFGVPSALDNSKALETKPFWPPEYSWDGVYRFQLGRSTLELPDDDQLKNSLLGIYVASGFGGVAVAWNTARAALDSFATPNHEEAQIVELKNQPGMTAEYEKKYAEFQAGFLYTNRRLASGKTLAEARARNANFRRRLVQTIDDILRAEEEAQRWYEKKLLELIFTHLGHQRDLIEEAWTKTYQIGLGDKKPPEGAVNIDDDVSSPKLKIRSTKDMVEVERYEKTRTPDGKEGRIQDATTKKGQVPGVIAALHQVGSLYFQYKHELEGRIEANKERRRKGAVAGAIEDLPHYKEFHTALQEQGIKHFVIWATYRKVIEDQAKETAFTQEMQDRCERLIIDALRDAWKKCAVVRTDAIADRLFRDEKTKCVTGRDEMGSPASAAVVKDVYEPPPPNMITASRTKAPPEMTRSPWLQAPFYALMLAVATNEGESMTVSKLPIDHLRPLFTSDEDRKRLLALKTFGSFVAAARQEMVSALTKKAGLDEKGRRNTSLAVAGLGLIGIPFTGGASLIVAGIVDAALVVGKTSSEISKWISAEQYSALVIDEMTEQAWREPAVSELMGVVFEAGFQIAGDLVQKGAVAHFFAAVGLTEMLAAGAGLAIGALKKPGGGA